MGNDNKEEGHIELELLSVVLKNQDNKLSSNQFSEFAEAAASFLSLPELQQKDREWLVDYSLNIINAERMSPGIADVNRVLKHVEIEANRIRQEMSQSQGERSTIRKKVSFDKPLPLLPQQLEKVEEDEYEVPDDAKQMPDKDQIINLNRLVRTPERFKGKKIGARRWLEDYEAACTANGWEEGTIVKHFSTFLEESARDWFISIIQPQNLKSWCLIRAKFLRYYVGPEELDALKLEIQRTRQKRDESIIEFIPRLTRLLMLVNPNMPEQEKVREIKVKLRNVYQDRLIGVPLTSLERLNDVCLEIEERLEITRDTKPKGPESSDKKSFNKSIKDRKPINNRREFGRARPPKTGSMAINKQAKPEDVVCYRCDNVGHYASKCFAKTKKDGSPVKPRPKTVAAVATYEEQSQDPEAPKVTVVKRLNNVCGMVSTNEPNGVFHKVEIHDHATTAFFDTGSWTSLINEDLASQMNLTPEIGKFGLKTIDGTPLVCLGEVKIPLSLTINETTKIVEITLIVVKDLCVQLLIGLQVMNWFKIVINCAKKQIGLEGDRKLMYGSGVRVEKPVLLPARSQSVVSAVINTKNIATPEAVLINPINFSTTVVMANTISAVQDSKVNTILANLENQDVIIEANTQLGTFESLHDDGHNQSLSAGRIMATLPLPNTTEITRVGDNLTESQVTDLAQIIEENIEAFSVGGKLGLARGVEHHIELLPNAKPVVEPLRRRPTCHEIETDRQIKTMLEEKIIEPSESPWASAYVLARKKNGELRLCVDFRKLNEVTKKSAYPLPRIDECIEPICGNRYYSQLDLASGFWQIPMSQESKELTAFRTKNNHYQFNRMPFGLTNAPSSFQRMMNVVFSKLVGVNLQIFIDDLCVATKTWDEHLRMLKKVFKLLINANLKLKPNKCIFGAPKVTFLGHEISENGVKQDPDKLRAIENLPKPTCALEVKRVLGLLSYYRNFVPNFAMIAEPLNNLTRKNVEFVWKENHNGAFEELKKALIKNATLSHFDPDLPVLLKTDASGQGIAGILLQQHTDGWKIVVCCSRRISKSEANYGISDLEGLALVFCLTKLRNYLLGRHFTVLTDHCALCALKLKNPNSKRLHRWALIISEFDFEIRYISGKLHLDVDCLSRAPVDNVEDEFLDDKVMAAIDMSAKIESTLVGRAILIDVGNWRKLSEEDAEGKDLFIKARQRKKGFKIFNGLLYYEERLFVPAAKRKELIIENHSSPQASHGGTRVTLDRMKKYFWSSMSNDVHKFVSECEICQSRKAERVRPSGMMHSFEITQPFELVAFDCLEKLPPSLNNNTHIVVAIDCFTRFVEAEACTDLKATTITNFIERFICRFGTPRTILTDNAQCFNNHLMKRLADNYNFEHKNSAPHHHQGNAMVERVIQTLQEKLALNLHDPNASMDWESNLPATLLSINTSRHASTGFPPFELLFGRRNATRSAETSDLSDAQALFRELRELRLELMMAKAIEAQQAANEKAKLYFDKRRKEALFEVGEKVWVKMPERGSKLQNRFHGPYIIVGKDKDIYQLQHSEHSTERLVRHISLLKKYISPSDRNGSNLENEEEETNSLPMLTPNNTLVCLILITSTQLSSSNPNQPPNPHQANTEVHFVKAKPVVWTRSKAYVSPWPTYYTLQKAFVSPGEIIRGFAIVKRAEMDEAVSHIHNVFLNQITMKLPPRHLPFQALSNQQGGHQEFLTPNHQPPGQGAGVAARHPNNQLSASDTSPRNHQLRKRNSIVDTVKTVSKVASKIQDYATGAWISNVIETVIDRIWPDQRQVELDQRLATNERRLNDLNHSANLTLLETKAMQENIQLSGKLVEMNVNKIEAMTFRYPLMTAVTSNIIAKMYIVGALLERISLSFLSKRPDLLALGELLETNILVDVDPSTVDPNSVRITYPSINTIRIQFAARRVAPGTSVFEVNAFKYIGDWTTNPTQFEYTGPGFLVFNETAHCISGIEEPKKAFVEAVCSEYNYEDPRLSNWRNSTDIDIATQVLILWPFSYVYCFPHWIEINGKQIDCPAWVIQLDAMIPWRTADKEHRPSFMEFEVEDEPSDVVVNVHDVHFKNKSHTINDVELYNLIRNKTDQVNNLIAEHEDLLSQKEQANSEWSKKLQLQQQNEVAAQFFTYTISFKLTTYILSVIVAGFVICNILKTMNDLLRAAAMAKKARRHTKNQEEIQLEAKRLIYDHVARNLPRRLSITDVTDEEARRAVRTNPTA